MLETIREYAAERLDQLEDAEAIRQRHAEYFLSMAEEAEPHLTGAQQATWHYRVGDIPDCPFFAYPTRISEPSSKRPGLHQQTLQRGWVPARPGPGPPSVAVGPLPRDLALGQLGINWTRCASVTASSREWTPRARRMPRMWFRTVSRLRCSSFAI